MKKTFFQILDDMCEADEKNKTGTCGVCPDFLGAQSSKQGSRITMGAPSEAINNIMSGKTIAILVLLDKEDYERRQKENHEKNTPNSKQ